MFSYIPSTCSCSRRNNLIFSSSNVRIADRNCAMVLAMLAVSSWWRTICCSSEAIRLALESLTSTLDTEMPFVGLVVLG